MLVIAHVNNNKPRPDDMVDHTNDGDGTAACATGIGDAGAGAGAAGDGGTGGVALSEYKLYKQNAIHTRRMILDPYAMATL